MANDTPTPTRKPAEPMEPSTRAFLIGVLAVCATIGGFMAFAVNRAYTSDDGRAIEKTKQVTACSNIEDALSAYACVVELNDED